MKRPFGIRTRLYIGAAIAAVVLVAGGLAGYAIAARVLAGSERAVTSLHREVHLGGQLAYAVARQLRLAENDVAGTPQVRAQTWALGDTIRDLQSGIAAGGPLVTDPGENAARALDLLTQVEGYFARSQLLTGLGWDSEADSVRSQASLLADSVLSELNAWLEQRTRTHEQTVAELGARATVQLRWLLLFFLGMGGLVMIIAHWTMLGITGPLNVLLRKLNRLEQAPGPAREIVTDPLSAAPLPEEIARLSQAIDDRSRAQQALRAAERLSSIGRIVSGVAHELNNPLASITLAANELTGHVPPESRQSVEIIQLQSRRAREVVQRLLTVARPVSREDMVDMEIGSFIADTLTLTKQRARERHIDVRFEEPARRCFVRGHPPLLRDALINVVVNAIQASPYRGIVAVQLSEGDDTTEVLISVTDSGPGIEPGQLREIFEPFFTTRSPGEGTGLGLALTRRIVEDHQGRISASNVRDSAPRGARIEIVLPLADCKAVVEAGLPAPGPTATDRSVADTGVVAAHGAAQRRILVVDDEIALRSLMVRILRRDGWIVDEAENGRDALEVIRGYSDEVARRTLVFSDIRMPLMDGLELHRELQRERPALADRFSFITGDNVAPSVREALNRSLRHVLEKPFEAAELLDFARRAWEQPG